MDKPKNKGGRPKGSDKWTEPKALELANEMLEWFKADKTRVFMMEFLVEEKGLYQQIVSDLTSKFDSFSAVIKRCKLIQETRLQKLTLDKQNPAGAIFLLKNHHGYADKQEIKTENLNYNYDPSDLRSKTADELHDLLSQETNTTR
jgi:signal transduction histidine kinase